MPVLRPPSPYDGVLVAHGGRTGAQTPLPPGAGPRLLAVPRVPALRASRLPARSPPP